VLILVNEFGGQYVVQTGRKAAPLLFNVLFPSPAIRLWAFLKAAADKDANEYLQGDH
jgi:hypothetical protein